MKEVSMEEFNKFWLENKPLKVFSSFTDSTGTSPIGNGYPYMITTYGKDDKEMVRIESRKEYESDREWQTTYYLL